MIAGAGAASGEDEAATEAALSLSSSSPPSPLATAVAASPRSSSSSSAAAPLPPISWADWAARVSSGRGATLAAEAVLRAAVQRGLGRREGGGRGGGGGGSGSDASAPSLSSSRSRYSRSSSSSLSAASRDLLCELSGSFALVLYDGATGQFLAAVDPAASRGLWFAPLEGSGSGGGGVAFTNDPGRAAELGLAAGDVVKW